MLLFYNHNIYFNFEANIFDKFYATCLPCCMNKDINKYFDNIEIFKTFNASTLANEESRRKILLSPQEFRGFVEDWIQASSEKFRKVYNWDAASFFMEYVNTIKKIAVIDAKYDFSGRWIGYKNLYDEEKLNIVNNIDISKKKPSPIIFTSACEPEFSTKVEDALHAYLKGTTSLYTNEVNDIIDYSVRKIKLSKELYQSFSKQDSLIQTDIRLDSGMKINEIDYTNPNCIFYFYYYSFLPGFSTNLEHLAKVLHAVGEKTK